MTMAVTAGRELRQRLVQELEEARGRTLLLVAPLSDEDLHLQHDPLMSPIVWDLGHIAHFEELWLSRNLDGPIEFVEMPGLYNPFEHPRSTRGSLPLPSLERVREVMDAIRSTQVATSAQTEAAAAGETSPPLQARGRTGLSTKRIDLFGNIAVGEAP